MFTSIEIKIYICLSCSKDKIQNSEIKFITDHFTATFLLVLISGDFFNLGLGKGKVLLQII